MTTASNGPIAPLNLPLRTRPRRELVQRAPSTRMMERTLRKESEQSTQSTWKRSELPGEVRAEAGASHSESAVYVGVTLLLLAPLLLWAGLSPLTLGLALVPVAAVTYLLLARRVVVGEGYVAVRRWGKFQVAETANIRHIELCQGQHEGLCIHLEDGRSVKIRRAELEADGMAEGIKQIAEKSSGSIDTRACEELQVHSGVHVSEKYNVAQH